MHINAQLDPKDKIQIVDAYSGDPRLKRMQEFFARARAQPSFPIAFIEKPKITTTKYGIQVLGNDTFVIHGSFDAEHYLTYLKTLLGLY